MLNKAQVDLRKVMFKLIDPFRIDYYQIEMIIDIFKTVKGYEFYDEDFLNFFEGLSRYSTQNQMTTMISIIQDIIIKYYNLMESYLTRRRAIECYGYIFERLLTYKDSK